MAGDDVAPAAYTLASLVRTAFRASGATRREESGRRLVDHDRSRVESMFAARASEWRAIYAGQDVRSIIHQERLARALELIDRLDLRSGRRALDLGAGAGLASVALAERGLQVDALDRVPEMLAQAADAARRAGMEGRIRAVRGDAHLLPYDNGSFDLVVALGVLPWLHTPERAVAEMARVLRPGGYLVVNVDNRKRFIHLVDPWRNPYMAPVRAWMRRSLGQRPSNRRIVTMHTPGEFDDVLARAGFLKLSASTLGFGPFTFAGRRVLPEPLASDIHAVLQRFADRGNPLIRSLGAQYLVLASRVPTPVVAGAV